jgi:hypothetical protein
LDRKIYDECLDVGLAYLQEVEKVSSQTSEIFLPITQHKQYSPSIYYSEGKFILNVTLNVDDRPFNVPFELAADQVANLNAQCAKALAPYVFYDLRRKVSE